MNNPQAEGNANSCLCSRGRSRGCRSNKWNSAGIWILRKNGKIKK